MMKKLLVLAVCVCSVAAAAAPLTAFAVEDISITDSEDLNDDEIDLFIEPSPTPTLFPEEEFSDSDTVSGNSIFDDELVEDFTYGFDFSVVDNDMADDISYSVEAIEPMSDYNSYYGTISSTYLEYMRGYLAKLSHDIHYVGARTGQYQYIFAYGKELNFDGDFFGSDITVITWNTQNNGSFHFENQSTFNLNPGTNMVYSDLSSVYPSLTVSSDLSLKQILYLLVIAFLVVFMNKMYQVNKIRRIKGL